MLIYIFKILLYLLYISSYIFTYVSFKRFIIEEDKEIFTRKWKLIILAISLLGPIVIIVHYSEKFIKNYRKCFRDYMEKPAKW